jgi:hypothetical protein
VIPQVSIDRVEETADGDHTGAFGKTRKGMSGRGS